jgi:magnesium-transporting ATPase (P-type)
MIYHSYARIELLQWLMTLPESGYQWNAEAARQANTGLRFWVYVTTVALTLLTLANAIAAWRSWGMLRNWWLGAAGVAAVDRIFTFLYFVPTMMKLMNRTLPESEAVSTALQWANLNHFRHIIVLIAWLAALKALSLLHERTTNPPDLVRASSSMGE